jgi:carbamoyl-phosphate synthase large subunit
VATYDSDPLVLDALADAVAARQWEPVTDHRVSALRLWARGWLLARPVARAHRPAASPAPDGVAGEDDDAVAVARIPVPPPPGNPPSARAAAPADSPPEHRPVPVRPTVPGTFARPSAPLPPPETSW